MTLRLDEPAFVLDLGLVPHRANTILDSGAIRSNLEGMLAGLETPLVGLDKV